MGFCQARGPVFDAGCVIKIAGYQIRLKKYFHIIIAIISFAYLLYISWHRWGNLVVDTFREPWTCYKLTQGKVLYKDLFYPYGFIIPYFISLIYKIFGVNLNYLVYLGIIITAICYIFVYKISRLFLNRAFSALAALTFLFVFAFGHYCYNGIFNFILPYSIPSTFFIMFILSGLHSFIKFIRKQRYKYLVYWIVSMYLAFLCRLDISFSVWIGFILVGLIATFKQKKYIYILYLSVPFLLSLFSYWLFLFINNAFSGFKESVIVFLFSLTKDYLFGISGLDNPVNNLTIVFSSFYIQFSAALLLLVSSVTLVSIYKKKKTDIVNILIYIILALISFLVVFCVLNFMHWFDQYRLMPLILISGIFFYRKQLPLLTLFSISFILILRTFMNVTPNHYSFFLAIPGLICYFIFFSDIYFSLSRRFITDIQAKNYYFFAFFIFFVFLAYPFIRQNYLVYRNKTFSVTTDRGTIVSFNDKYTRGFWETVNYLKNTPEDSKVVVFPEGIGINFFSHRDTPLKYYSFLPLETETIIKEDKLIKQLESNKIDYIIILSQFIFEHKQHFFGIDYGKKIYSWIIKNYRLIKLIDHHPVSLPYNFGIAIYQKI